MNLTVLAIVGCLIVAGLAIYAGYLLVKLKQQKALVAKHRELAIEKRNANIFENVNTLCMVGIQGQCDLSEISIRVYCIMDYVQGEQRIDFENNSQPFLSCIISSKICLVAKLGKRCLRKKGCSKIWSG